MNLDDINVGDYIYGEVKKDKQSENNHIGENNNIEILSDVGQNKYTLVRVTDTESVGVVAEPIDDIDIDSGTVWVQRGTDINPYRPSKTESTPTFDKLSTEKVSNKLNIGSSESQSNNFNEGTNDPKDESTFSKNIVSLAILSFIGISSLIISLFAPNPMEVSPGSVWFYIYYFGRFIPYFIVIVLIILFILIIKVWDVLTTLKNNIK